MSFGGITNFAKSALLTAQKHIDSALQIEEDSEDEEAAENEKDPETEREDAGEASSSMYESAILDTTDQQKQKEREASGNSSRKEDEGKAPSQNDDTEFLDVDLNANSPPQSHWGDQGDKVQTVVDTEPNPIRDGHEPNNILHYSPSSHSPDDDESSQNGQSTSTAPIGSSLELSLINLEKEKENDELETRSLVRGPSERTLDRFEDVRTIASSDIEVIGRHTDDWSIASSQNIQNTQPKPHSSISLKEVLHRVPAEMLISRSESSGQSQQELVEQIAVLAAKLKHRDQRIEELGRLNENLKANNSNLSAKNKQKTSAESKLQSQLTEKEKQLNDLLEEGKKLSEYSGRQAKEIRKLKQQLSQLEALEAARDSAMEELQEAHEQINEQEKTIDKLKADCEKAEKKADQTKSELEKAQANSEKLEAKLCEQLTQLEETKAEVKRLQKEMKTVRRERDEFGKENKQLSAKLMGKTAQERVGGEREKGLMDDLKAEQAKNASATARIRELEQRLESIQDAQRDIAVEISNANSPLLHTISTLEEKVFSLERQNDSLSRSFRQANDQLNDQKRKYELELESTVRSLEEERQISNQKAEELARACSERADMLKKLKDLEDELIAVRKTHSARVDRLELQMDELEGQIKAKRTEVFELEAKNRELQQKMRELERKFQTNAPLFTAITPTAQPIKSSDSEEISVKQDFQQQREMFRAQKTAFQLPQKFASSSPTSGQVKVDLNLPGAQGADYTLDFASTEHLRSELDSAHAQLFQLHERFDHLLELYGGCLESIEEMKEDNEDLRKLCREQALRLSEFQRRENLSSPNPEFAAGDEEDGDTP